MRRTARTFVALVAGIVLLAGCAPSETAPEVAPSGAASVSSDPINAAQLRLPLEAYIVSGAEAHAYNAAERILTNRCLERFGFAPDPEAGEFTPASAAVSSFTARRYLLVDAEQAALYAYNTGLTPAFVEQDENRKKAAAAAKAAAPSDPAQLAARRYVLSGEADSAAAPVNGTVPEGGCIGESNRALRGSSEGLSWSPAAIEIQQLAYDRSMADPRVAETFAAWSACMAESGFTYPTPIEANNDPAWSGDTVDPREISTAVADVACKEKVNLVEIWSGVEAEVQQYMIDERAAELTEARAKDEATLEAVARVLADAGS